MERWGAYRSDVGNNCIVERVDEDGRQGTEQKQKPLTQSLISLAQPWEATLEPNLP
jgi:hypothetical protein